MSITVTGLGSGLDYDSWIESLVGVKQAEINAVKAKMTESKTQASTLDSIEGYYNKLLDSITKFTGALSNDDLFNQKAVTSSTEAVTATVTAKSSVQNLSIEVSQLATATTAESTYAVASYVDGSSKLSSISSGFKAGTFSLYVDGQKNTLTLTSDMTMDDVLDQINGNEGKSIEGIDGVTATLVDGKLTLSAESGHTITAGASSDTSNFSNAMALTRNSSTGVYSSSKSIFDTSVDTSITNTTFRKQDGSEAKVGAGTFFINDTKFTIGSTSTLEGIVDTINKSDAGVSASWNATTGKLELTSAQQGAVSIDIQAGTSNFTDVMGLTSGGGLIPDSQTLGTNAILTINDTTITSSSNTVTSDISGIKGLTLTLNDKTEKAGEIAITQDTSGIAKAITDVVSAYNLAISNTDSATASSGDLHGETLLSSLRNKIRTLITSSIPGGEDGFKNLASIGITTGTLGNTEEVTGKLTIDNDKLEAALKDNADGVKNLLLGEGTTQGIFDKVETVLDNATNIVSGYFVTREETFDKQTERLSEKIEKMETNLEAYKKKLEAKFQAMDELIASVKKSASIFDSYFNKDNSSDS